uniref:TMC domain-containing protein n=1 Tax=Romanomermis culicivorax TaxID=13658 RepID=A0A915IHJ8_ROMCU
MIDAARSQFLFKIMKGSFMMFNEFFLHDTDLLTLFSHFKIIEIGFLISRRYGKDSRFSRTTSKLTQEDYEFLCWETMVGEPEYGEFKVAENVLHLINNQGMIWLGLFFAPLLPMLNNVKIIIILYVRAWAVVTCNVPAGQVFRASSGRVKFWSVITDELPAEVYQQLDHFSSPGIVLPVFVLLVLIVYFLVSLIRGLREANEDLQKQLILERTEEKRKVYRMADLGKKKYNDERGSMALPNTHRGDGGEGDHDSQSSFGIVRRETWHPVRNAVLAKVEFKRSAPTKDSQAGRVRLADEPPRISPALAKKRVPVDTDLEPQIPLLPQPPPPTAVTVAGKHSATPSVQLFVPMLNCLPEESKSGGSSEQSDNEPSPPQRRVTAVDRKMSDAATNLLFVGLYYSVWLAREIHSTTIGCRKSLTDRDVQPKEPQSAIIEMAALPRRMSLVTPGLDLAPSPIIRSTHLTFDFNPKDSMMTPPLQATNLYQTALTGSSGASATEYDSGRATMEGSTNAGYGPPATTSATETDTGTESEMEQSLIKKKSSTQYPKPRGFYNRVDLDEEDDVKQKTSAHFDPLPNVRKVPITSDKSLATRFAPWPSIPDNELESLRRPYIIRQSSTSRTPSPGPVPNVVTSPMSQSAYSAPPAEPLSVIDEGLSFDRSRAFVSRPKRRAVVTFSPSGQQDLIFFDPHDKTSQQRPASLTVDDKDQDIIRKSERTNVSGADAGPSVGDRDTRSVTDKPKHKTSKETVTHGKLQKRLNCSGNSSTGQIRAPGQWRSNS